MHEEKTQDVGHIYEIFCGFVGRTPGMGIPWGFPRVFRGYGRSMGIEVQSTRQSWKQNNTIPD